MSLSPDVHYADLGSGRKLCSFCAEDERIDGEAVTWVYSSQVLLTCDQCGETNETTES